MKGEKMESLDSQFQRRAIVGDRHFILADPDQPDQWALAGPIITNEDEQGNRSYGKARTISTKALKTWAQTHNRRFSIIEKFPVIRRSITEAIAA